jgi:hypothetical protein
MDEATISENGDGSIFSQLLVRTMFSAFKK